MTHSLSDVESLAAEILNPSRIFALHEIKADPTLVPKERGAYGWWFDTSPPGVPIEKAQKLKGFHLLYVGIAPSAPTSKRTLRDRLKNHCRGPIAVSTLRRSLAVLLDRELQLKVGRQFSGKLYIDQGAEARLTAWMDQHARVCWAITPEPWKLERHLISTGPFLPLNIKGALHPFVPELRRMRSSVKGVQR
jgi:hypothetical protein